jgi:hypothetical protein
MCAADVPIDVPTIRSIGSASASLSTICGMRSAAFFAYSL